MLDECIYVEESSNLEGQIDLVGAKNATLVIMASSLLINGTLKLKNIPQSQDVFSMIQILQELGAKVDFDLENHSLQIDSSSVTKFKVNPEVMRKMRASILIMGPLLARFGKAQIAAPGGCSIGKRPINFHINNFKIMGVHFIQEGRVLNAEVDVLKAQRLVFEYPSVGTTENIIMASTLIQGTTTIVNASLEPEVMDLICLLKKMGAKISILPPATIEIEGVSSLSSTEHTIMNDRLEAGALLLAAAITAGNVYLPNAFANHLDVFLLKLKEMGHFIEIGENGIGIRLIGTKNPIGVSFKTGPYPCFPTDLQSPMLVAQCISEGISEVEETVFENRLLSLTIELQKMGAKLKLEGNKVTIIGVKELIGKDLIANDIRASCALVLAGLKAKGKTIINGVQLFKRAYDNLDQKFRKLGAKISIEPYNVIQQRFLHQLGK